MQLNRRQAKNPHITYYSVYCQFIRKEDHSRLLALRIVVNFAKERVGLETKQVTEFYLLM